jgi:hypothetical protein
MQDPAPELLIRLAIALLFAAAAAHKLRGLAGFAETLAAYRVLPEWLARRAAWCIPCAELAAALALLWEPRRLALALPAVGLLLLYAGAMGVNLARGRRDLDCGCGTARERRFIAAWMVWRNVILAAVLGAAAWPNSSRPPTLTDLLTIAGGLAVSAALYVAVDRLLGDVAPRAALLRRPA